MDLCNIYTVDESKPRVQCISIEDSTIVDTGNLGEITRRRLPATVLQHYLPEWVVKAIRRAPKVFYVAPQAAVVPGLADAHAHVLEYGFMMQLPLATATSVEDVVARIKAYIVAHSDILDDRERWIEGMGWDQTKWPGAKFPTASDLDQDPLLSGRPISLNRVDGHAKWVSPRVLELMGELPDVVDGGNIVRDADGRPTGIFVDNAMALIPTPAWTEQRMSDYFDTTMWDALSHGLTSIHDAMSYPDQIRFFKRKADEGKLPNRLYLMGHLPSNDYWGDQIPHLLNYGKHERLTVKSVKLVTDGALGSWGAALLEPYSDKPETSGLMLTPPDELSTLVHQFWNDGFQVNIHCIGDRANHVVLDIFEDILHDHKANVTEWRPRIEHAQILTLEDLQRMGKLGVIASVQPTHATSDMTYAEFRLGPERIKGAYAYQTLLQVSPNHVLPLGSDFPVESINPLLGFYAAVSRLDTNGSSPHGNGGWFPHERLTRAQALKGMTLDAAYASFAENDLGSLTPGKKADFVVLDRDIMTVPFAEILETKVSATVVDGKVAYGAL
ncbi:putative amidohydrolase family protein [Lyophyllum shimeji]|uniref:Amidohydrolase family protein n=1 Tax=Lyophyllum shimeji TaxID=47721 RepID=A0A9P3PYZ6_LYOSH|nr:putative amidohydrolase family protein [Lyophyllum shimeji]